MTSGDCTRGRAPPRALPSQSARALGLLSVIGLGIYINGKILSHKILLFQEFSIAETGVPCKARLSLKQGYFRGETIAETGAPYKYVLIK